MARGFIDTADHVFDFEAFIREIEAPSITTEIAAFVKAQFDVAKTHRMTTGVEKMMLDGIRAYHSMYRPEDLALMEQPDEVYIGVTNLKCRALQSWISDLLVQAEDKPWTLTTTPLPELPKKLEDIVINRLTLDLKDFDLQSPQQFEDLAVRAKSVANDIATRMAEEANGRMEAKINDQLVEGGWRTALEEVVVDMSIMPSAVLKGPVMRKTKTVRWIDGEVRQSEEFKVEVRRVNPVDIYPAPNAKCTQSGNFIIERVRMSHSEMFDCIGLHGFDEVALRKVLADNPNGATAWLGISDSELDMLTAKDTDAACPDQQYHVLCYFGKLPTRMLVNAGIVSLSDVDAHSTTEVELWVCGGEVLRAITNPYPMQMRPYHVAPYQPQPGSFWGRSLPSILEDVQRMTNATARALIKNMAFSAGPIGEYDQERMVAEDDIESMQPYRMFAVKSDPFGSATSAIRFQSVENVTYRFLQAYEVFKREADDVSGIPAYALGQPNTAGAGRTLGGLSMLMGNAAKGVKRVVGMLDKGVTEPLVSMVYYLNLIYSKDDTIKADASVVARGSSGLLQRELSQARAVEVLQVLTPYAANGLVDPTSVLIVLRDVVKSLGYSADELVPDPNRQRLLQAAAAQVGVPSAPGMPPAQISPAAPGTPLPQLDGRSSAPPMPDESVPASV